MNFAKPIAAAALVAGLVSSTLATAADVNLLDVATIGKSSVLAWSWGASNSGSTHTGGGGGAGKANVQDISLTRATDSQSPKFVQAVVKGTRLPTVTFQDGPVIFTLTDVLVTSYSTGGSTEKKATLTENITLNFAKFTYQVNAESFTYDATTTTSSQ